MVIIDFVGKKVSERPAMLAPYVGFIAAIHVKTGSFSIGTISEIKPQGILVDDNEGNNFLIKWGDITVANIRGEGDWASAQGVSNNSKTEIIKVRVKFEDLVTIKQAAEASCQKVGPFVLDAALDKARRTKVLR